MVCDSDLATSQQMQEEMLKCAEEFYQSLGFPYQVINIVSGKIRYPYYIYIYIRKYMYIGISVFLYIGVNFLHYLSRLLYA